MKYAGDQPCETEKSKTAKCESDDEGKMILGASLKPKMQNANEAESRKPKRQKGKR